MSEQGGRFAVVLNKNAKRVTGKVEDLSGEIVPPEDLFLSESADDAVQIAATLIARGYETVFAGGGDGTVMHLINSLARYPVERQPVVGILKLGTGNAMARMVCSGHLEGDLKAYVHSATREYYPLSLVESEGQRSAFAGLGIDAEILNDYRAMKESLGKTVLKPVLQTVGGYFISFFARTATRHLRNAFTGKPPTVTVVTRGRADRVGAEGKALARFKPGDTIFEGPATIAMVGTVPYYGYGLKVLPYANQDPERMQLRLANLGVVKGLAILPSVWKGDYSGSVVNDFLVEQVELTCSCDMPYQVGGDAAGYRSSAAFTVVPRAVRLLKLL